VKYALLHAVDENALEDPLPDAVENELTAWVNEMLARGVVLDGARLRSTSDATTVRAPGGDLQVTDGPFAETKEQIAGYDVIECPDMDAAVAVAAAHPTTAIGAIEVRAFLGAGPDPQVPETVPDDRRRYLLLVCAAMGDAPDASDSSDADEDEEGPDIIERWIADAGDRRMYGWQLTHPSQAVTVRRVGGQVVTTDGPFAETKEQVAGFDLLECADLDDALEVAAGHPVVGGGVLELRPLWR
jgi:hypothetical protein